ncbi:MAG: hypothetical protein R3B48_16835 [Kofleriaceae bacterium]
MPRSRLLSLCLSLVALVSLPGCPLLQLEAEVSQVCVARSDIAAPSSGGQRELVLSVTLDDLAALGDLLDDDDVLHFTRAAARPRDGLASLAFVERAEISIVVEDSAALRAFACDGTCGQPDGSLVLGGASDANAAPYLKAPQVTIEVTLVGDAPTQEWTLDAEVCLAGKLTRTLTP